MAGRSFVHTHLGIRLRALREHAGMSPYDVARTPNIGSRGALLRLEKGETRDVLMPVVDHLCKCYGADRDLRYELRRMAIACNDSTSDSWWEPIDIPSWAGLLLELEPKATTISSYESENVAGLLQTERTIRAVVAATGQAAPEEAERLVQRRLKRQERIFHGRSAPQVNAVLSEAVIRRPIGGTDVHAEQLEYLKAMAQRPDVNVSVVTFDVGSVPGTGHTFVMLDLPEKVARPVVYSESALGSNYSDALGEVSARKAILRKLEAASVPIGEFLLWQVTGRSPAEAAATKATA